MLTIQFLVQIKQAYQNVSTTTRESQDFRQRLNAHLSRTKVFACWKKDGVQRTHRMQATEQELWVSIRLKYYNMGNSI